MPKDNVMELEGEVISGANGKFKVKINDNYSVLATLSGKIRQAAIKVIPGDTVKLEISEYDTSKGRITYRIK